MQRAILAHAKGVASDGKSDGKLVVGLYAIL